MRAVSVHSDAIVVTSLLWRTTATAIRNGEESMLVDSPYFPEELELLPAILGQAGFEPTALLATHADFDHLLGRLAFPDLTVGVAESTAERIQRAPGAVQRELREADAEHYVERPRPLSLGQVQALPVPGHLEIGDAELELLWPCARCAIVTRDPETREAWPGLLRHVNEQHDTFFGFRAQPLGALGKCRSAVLLERTLRRRDLRLDLGCRKRRKLAQCLAGGGVNRRDRHAISLAR